MEKPVKENSTEKLLNVIRGISNKSPKIDIPKSQQQTKPANLKKIKENQRKKIQEKIKEKISKKISKKTFILGVLLNREDITFVLSSSKSKAVIKWKIIKHPDNLGIEDKGYASFLGSQLEDFTGGKKGIPAWCSIDSDKLKLRNITIPDVAPSKIPNAAFWGLKKEIEFEADQEIFDFIIIGDVTIQGVKKKNLLAFTAQKNQINKLKTLFSKAGIDLKGITTIPFAIQNFIHTHHLQIQDSPFTIVKISRENSEIVCFSDSGILLTRNIRIGSYHLVENFIKSAGKNVAEYLSTLKSIQSDGFLKIKASCERLIEKIVRTSEYCSQNFANNVPMKKFYFFGEAADCDPFLEFTAETTLTDVAKFDPVFDTLPGSIYGSVPEDADKRGIVITAFGISLSSNDYTPNFLNTHNDKLKNKKKRNFNIASFLMFALILLFCISFTNWQGFVKNREVRKLDDIIQLKNNLNPDVNQESMTHMILEAEKKVNLRNQYISDYFPLAVVNEICSATPSNVRVSSLMVDFSDQTKKEASNKETPKNLKPYLIISGLIKSTENNSESDFTLYILNIENAKIFGEIEVLQKNIDAVAGKIEILNFKVRVEII